MKNNTWLYIRAQNPRNKERCKDYVKKWDALKSLRRAYKQSGKMKQVNIINNLINVLVAKVETLIDG